MRTLALFLLFLNLVWFAWQQGLLPWGSDTEPTRVRAPFQQAPQRLLLLDELPAEQRALLEEIAESRQRIAAAEERAGEVEEVIAGTREQLEAAGSPQPAPAPWCAEVGPFADEAAVQAYLARLSGFGGEGRSMVREEPVASTWWVHTQPYATEAAARALLDELQGKGIDSYYMRTGDLAGGISLGVFSRQESALVAQAQLAEQGYMTEISQVFRNAPRYYADILLADSAVLESPQWQEFRGADAVLQASEKLCEVIARENQFP